MKLFRCTSTFVFVLASFLLMPSFAFASPTRDLADYRTFSFLVAATGSRLIPDEQYSYLQANSYDEYLASYGDSPSYDISGHPSNVAAVLEQFKHDFPASYALVHAYAYNVSVLDKSYSFLNQFGERAFADAQRFYARYFAPTESDIDYPQDANVVSATNVGVDGSQFHFDVNDLSFSVPVSSALYQEFTLRYTYPDLDGYFALQSNILLAYRPSHGDYWFVVPRNRIVYRGSQRWAAPPVLYGSGYNFYLFNPYNFATFLSSNNQSASVFNTSGSLSRQMIFDGVGAYFQPLSTGSSNQESYDLMYLCNVGIPFRSTVSGSGAASSLPSSSPLNSFRDDVASSSAPVTDSSSYQSLSDSSFSFPSFNLVDDNSRNYVYVPPASTSSPLPDWTSLIQDVANLDATLSNGVLPELIGFHNDMNSDWQYLFNSSFDMLWDYLDVISSKLGVPSMPDNPFDTSSPDTPGTVGWLDSLFNQFLSYTPLGIIQAIQAQLLSVSSSAGSGTPLSDAELSYSYGLALPTGQSVSVDGDLASYDTGLSFRSAVRAATTISYVILMAWLIVKYARFINTVIKD